MKNAKIRLFVDQAISDGQTLSVTSGQAHYLFSVMRIKAGGQVLVFDGQNGEWLAEVVDLSKRAGLLRAVQQKRTQTAAPDVWLCFAPVKKARLDMIVEKATELGATRLVPVLTAYTNSDRLRMDRMRAQVVEAAEQCGALVVPEIAEPVSFAQLLDNWPEGRKLVFCDEHLAGQSTPNIGDAAPPAAILIGPEGGFAPNERERLGKMPGGVALALGPRILRAETAVFAALSLWQVAHGDWRAN